MKNSNFNSADVKRVCERKLNINFRAGKELNGWFEFQSKKVARITVPKGKKFITRKTYSSMAKQLKLSIEEFDNLLECPLQYSDYLELIKSYLEKFQS